EKVSENARRAAVRSDWGFSRCLAERSGRTAYGEFLVISWSLAWLVDQDGALEPAMAGSLARCGQEDGMGAGYAVHKRPLSIEVERVAVPGALAVDLGDCAARPVQVKSEPDAVQAVRRRGADPGRHIQDAIGQPFPLAADPVQDDRLVVHAPRPAADNPRLA